jgi:hypothetical protein
MDPFHWWRQSRHVLGTVGRALMVAREAATRNGNASVVALGVQRVCGRAMFSLNIVADVGRAIARVTGE